MSNLITLNTDAQLLRIKVNLGDFVTPSSILAIYKDGSSDLERKLKSNYFGNIGKIYFKKGDHVKSGCDMFQINNCTHDAVMKDLCAMCGVDLKDMKREEKNKISMVHSIPELVISEKHAQQLGLKDEKRLLSEKRLSLIVDLDQTILHTTNKTIPDNLLGVHHYQLNEYDNCWYHTKLRPHAVPFLRRLSALFELHICTFGSRTYAHNLASIIDGDKKLFSHRILSRNECYSMTSKSDNLKSLFPIGDSMTCIIDDRHDVWNYADNVMQVKPYVYFLGTGDINALGKDEKVKTSNINQDSVKTINIDSKIIAMNRGDENLMDCPLSAVTYKPPKVECDGKLAVKSPGFAAGSGDCSTNPANPTNIAINTEDPVGSPKLNKEEKKEEDEKEEEANVDMLQGDLDLGSSSSSEDEDQDHDGGNGNIGGDTGGDIGGDTGGKEHCESEVARQAVPTNDAPTTTSEVTRGTDKERMDCEDARDKEVEPEKKEVKIDDPSEGETDTTVKLNAEVKVEIGDGGEGEGVGEDKVGGGGMKGDEGTVLDCGNVVAEEGGGGRVEVTPPAVDVEATPLEATPPSGYTSMLVWPEEDNDYLLHLEVILQRIHAYYYAVKAGRVDDGIPLNVNQIAPFLKSKTLAGCSIVFSGVFPLNKPVAKHYTTIVLQLGGQVTTTLQKGVTSHLIARNLGTSKVRQAKEMKNIEVVSIKWLWACLQQWVKVDESSYLLNTDEEICEIPLLISKNTPVLPELDKTLEAETTEEDKQESEPPRKKICTISHEELLSLEEEINDDSSLDDSSDDSDKEDSDMRRKVMKMYKTMGDNYDSSESESMNNDFPKGWKQESESDESLDILGEELEKELTNNE